MVDEKSVTSVLWESESFCVGGVFPRDIKPRNISIVECGPYGVVKFLDLMIYSLLL